MSVELPVASTLADVEEFLRASTHIDPNAVHDEYVRVPGQLAYWGAQLADARHEADDAQLQFELTEARLLRDWRLNLEAQAKLDADELGSVKKPVAPARVTDSAVAAAVTCDPRWASAKQAVLTTKHQVARLQAVVTAVEAKLSALTGLGAHLRSEMNAGIALRNPNLGSGRGSPG